MKHMAQQDQEKLCSTTNMQAEHQASKQAPTSLLQPSVSWCPSVPEGSAEHQQRVQPQQQHWEAGRALQIATRS